MKLVHYVLCVAALLLVYVNVQQTDINTLTEQLQELENQEPVVLSRYHLFCPSLPNTYRRVVQ